MPRSGNMRTFQEADVLMAMSKFAGFLTKSRLGTNSLRKRVHDYKASNSKPAEKTFTASGSISNMDFIEQFDLWLTELLKYIKEVKLLTRITAFGVFADYHDYIYILRSPIRRDDREIRLPIYNITLPENKFNDFTHAIPIKRTADFVKTNKCKRAEIAKVCGSY
ncbi:uncharacterized protein LOC117222382 [Megalopta genalis]|uniref:uncharacterized protein LOC117222382 n=1 Tax=Megalopta genalis TaxID=115081 RepID=UPI003FD39F60